jgi:hypothetical protein
MKSIWTNRIEYWRKFLYAVTSRKGAIILAAVAVLAITITLLLTGVLTPSSPPSELISNCTLSVLSGNVEIQKYQTVAWVSGSDGATLVAGDKLRTTADSQALLTFFEGSTLKVGPESVIEIQQISQSQPGQTTIILKQLVGTTWSRVVHMADPGSRYEIVTPASYALVRGTEFETEVDEKGVTTLQVSQGTVAVQAQGQEVLVLAGYKVNVEPGAAPEEPLPIVPNPTAPAATSVVTPTPKYTLLAPSASIPAYSPGNSPVPTSSPAASTPSPTTSPSPTPTPTPTPTSTPGSGGGGGGGGGGGSVPIAPYNVTVNVSGQGTVSKSPDQTSYNYGAVITLNGTPATGWTFGGWSGDVNSANNPLSITVDGNKTINATFIPNSYTLTINNSGNGTVSKSPDQVSYNYGTTVTLNSIPSIGWSFSSWSGDVSSSTNPLVLTVDGNKTLTANFNINSYSVNASVSGNGSASPTSQSIGYGSNVSITISPDPGYHIASITDNGSAVTVVNPYVISNVTGSHTVVVTMAINTYNITVNAGANGSITPPGPLGVNYGDTPTFTITPATGCHINDVLVDSASMGALSSYTFSPVSANHTLSASFLPNQYSLAISYSGNGSVSKNPDQATYSHGATVTLNGTAASGWSFGAWSGDLSGSTNPVTITMDGNKSITANFTQIMKTLTITGGANGSVTQPGTGTFTFGQGAVVNLVANPNMGFVFGGWTGNTVDVADINVPSTTITMNDNYVIQANFATAYRLTISSDSSGTVTLPGEGTYYFTPGSIVPLLAVPNMGYSFEKWEGNKETVANEHAAATTVTMNGNYSINAKFN